MSASPNSALYTSDSVSADGCRAGQAHAKNLIKIWKRDDRNRPPLLLPHLLPIPGKLSARSDLWSSFQEGFIKGYNAAW